MRTFLLWFGWISLIGSLFDGAIAAFLGWLVFFGDAPISLTVDAHLKDHLPFIYWVRDVAEFLFPEGFVEWLFGLPALLYFPIRVLVSVIVGGWALRAAGEMKN